MCLRNTKLVLWPVFELDSTLFLSFIGAGIGCVPIGRNNLARHSILGFHIYEDCSWCSHILELLLRSKSCLNSLTPGVVPIWSGRRHEIQLNLAMSKQAMTEPLLHNKSKCSPENPIFCQMKSRNEQEQQFSNTIVQNSKLFEPLSADFLWLNFWILKFN